MCDGAFHRTSERLTVTCGRTRAYGNRVDRQPVGRAGLCRTRPRPRFDARRTVGLAEERAGVPPARCRRCAGSGLRRDALGISRGIRGDGRGGRALRRAVRVADAGWNRRVRGGKGAQGLGNPVAWHALDLSRAGPPWCAAGDDRAVRLAPPSQLRGRCRRTGRHGADDARDGERPPDDAVFHGASAAADRRGGTCPRPYPPSRRHPDGPPPLSHNAPVRALYLRRGHMALAGMRSALFSFGSHNPWRGSALAALIVLSVVTSPAAQAPPAPADPAVRAYREGRYDEVQRVLKNANDPRSVALKARALSAIGRYGEAEKMLAPVASSAPTSDAALELGLLQHELGRRADA